MTGTDTSGEADTGDTGDTAAEHARRRAFRRAVLISTVCTLVWAVSVYFDVWLNDRTGRGSHPVFFTVDGIIGLAAAVAAGPVRSRRTPNLALVAVGSLSNGGGGAVLVGLVRLGRLRSWRLAAVLVAYTVLVTLARAWVRSAVGVDPGGVGLDVATLVAILMAAGSTALALLWGAFRSSRAALIESLRTRAEQAEAARVAAVRGREADLARTRAEERTAIAREMHDDLSHQLSIIAMHAGALAYRTDLPPEQVRDTARTVRDAAEDANGVLRHVLSALRTAPADGALGPDTAPHPTTETTTTLLARARADGRVVVDPDGIAPEDLPVTAATAAAVHRIVGELLANAVRHAPGTVVTLRFDRCGDELVIHAVNPVPDDVPPAPGGGLGLVGVQERAQLLGGTARHERTGSRFEVEVRIPWRT
ncbi:sensor histidine kinase [Pseudonocardia phyllosphaerae]|uniref:sensor histidine kinase n=1 Tax=Pseudonocardia phyllosphaerae TaxID=3390502 RepID=UPI00397DE8EA